MKHNKLIHIREKANQLTRFTIRKNTNNHSNKGSIAIAISIFVLYTLLESDGNFLPGEPVF